MAGIGWFAAIFVGALAGWLAEKFMERDHSLLMNIVLGIAGALVFNFVLVTILGSTLGGWIGQTFAGFVGACALIAGAQMMRNR
ncbi:MAG: GlsB/YeaQ/YmgE family stress response membrane protein [Sulfitobacter sp.]